MQSLWTFLLLAVTVRGSAASGGNGDPSPAIKMRVVGGQTITNAELGGYIVAMHYSGEFICGGTLIQDTIVLTAAHCFMNREQKKEWDFIGGISELTETGERSKMEAAVISPDFRPNDFHSDIAIVLLQKPLVGKNIGKVSLCSKKLEEGTPLVVSGWGLTKDGAKQQKYLRSVTVPVMEWNACRRKFQSADVELTNTMLCAGVLGSKDACLYDSGGPLVYNKEICGVVSYGIGCAHKEYPGVYTDIFSMKAFIERSIERLLTVY